MARIREVIRDTDTPSWLSSVPRNFGDASAGNLKADEWRTMSTVYLPISLVSLWGEGTSHRSPSVAASLREVLDHTMALVSAVSLACARTMTSNRMLAYQNYITHWVGQLPLIHSNSRKRTNFHMAIHVYDFLRLFGPVRSWWSFPFERLVGQLQRLPHNHKFGIYHFSYDLVSCSISVVGELEATMGASFIKAAKLRHWLARPDCPEFLKECKIVFDKAFGSEWNTSNSETIAESAFRPVPNALEGIISERRVALRARHKFDNAFFCCSSTHVGNSLILFYPGGNRSETPVPGSIEYIVAKPNNDIVYVVRRQLPAPPGALDPFRFYLHFPAKIYSPELSKQRQVIQPEWVFSHYARWNFDKDRAVVLTLSRVSLYLIYYHSIRCLQNNIQD